jgi:hypothetical protein
LVGKDGVRVDPKRIEPMQYWPHPKTLKSLRGFLGLTGYYRKFVNNYENIAAPLVGQLRGGVNQLLPCLNNYAYFKLFAENLMKITIM